MTWARFDDQYPNNIKVSQLSDVAFRMHVSAICFACSQLTNGFVPNRQLQRLVFEAWDAAVDELVAAGLFERVPGGILVHDFLDYNPSRESIEARREHDRRRKGSARIPNGIDADSVGPVPYPVPEPDNPDPNPSETPNARAGAGARAREEGLREAFAQAVYGQAVEELPPSEQDDVAEAAANLAGQPAIDAGEVERRVRHYRVMWPHLGAPSARAVSRNWTRIGQDERQRTEGARAPDRDDHDDVGERRRRAFAAAGLLGDADDGAARGGRDATRPDGLPGVPEPRPAARGLHDVQRSRGRVPDVPGSAADRAPPPR